MYGALKKPPANNSPEAIALRTLALKFGRQQPNNDPHDRPGQRLNRALLKAARAYGRAARKALKAPSAVERNNSGS